MYKIGVTGGIGSGKSTVCELLRDRGVAVYDSDSRAKQLMAESEALREQLIAAFGAECYNAEGLNRAFLASKVFGNEEALQQLNSIVHPAVRADFQIWAEQQQSPYVVLEGAILFEAGFEDTVDAVVMVYAPESLRIERAMKRDNATEQQIRARIAAQMDDEEKS